MSDFVSDVHNGCESLSPHGASLETGQNVMSEETPPWVAVAKTSPCQPPKSKKSLSRRSKKNFTTPWNSPA